MPKKMTSPFSFSLQHFTSVSFMANPLASDQHVLPADSLGNDDSSLGEGHEVPPLFGLLGRKARLLQKVQQGREGNCFTSFGQHVQSLVSFNLEVAFEDLDVFEQFFELFADLVVFLLAGRAKIAGWTPAYKSVALEKKLHPLGQVEAGVADIGDDNLLPLHDCFHRPHLDLVVRMKEVIGVGHTTVVKPGCLEVNVAPVTVLIAKAVGSINALQSSQIYLASEVTND